MTLCEEKYRKATIDNIITIFDYDIFVNEGGKSKYDPDFISNLPDYYFLGLPIKEIIKSNCSNKLCHFLSLALGLCFDDFELVVSNQKNYLETYNKVYNKNIIEFEHTYIIVSIDGTKKVIDIPRGIIMDVDAYYDVFGIEEKYKYTKQDFINEEPVKLILDHINDISPKLMEGDKDENKIRDYKLFIEKYIELCENYSNVQEFKLAYFIKRCLLATSGWNTINRLTSILTSNTFNSYEDDSKNNSIQI